MKPIILHCFDYLNRGGTEMGLCTLAREGFYAGGDVHFLALARGQGGIETAMADLVGPDHLSFLTDRPDLVENGRLSPGLIADLIDRLAQVIERLKPTTLILSLPITNFVGRMAAMRFADLRVIGFEHFAIAGRYQDILGPIAHRCAAVFGDTPETLRAMRGLYPVECPSYYVPMVVLDPVTPRTIQTPDSFDLLSFGRLVPAKNYAELLYAVAALKGEGLRCRLVIYGEGEERKNLEDRVQSLGLAEQVSLPGFMADTGRLAQLRHQAHIYVQPSLEEGFCLSVAEALAAGMVVAATATGGIHDYGVDRRNMFVIKGFARDGITNALREIMTSYAAVAAPISAAAIATAQEKFSRKAVQALWEPARALLL